MQKWTDPRTDHALHEGDKLVCCGREYTITGPPLGFGGSACVYPASSGDNRKLAIKECMPGALDLKREGVLIAKNQEDALRLTQYRARQSAEVSLSQQIASTTRRAIGVWEMLLPQSLIVDGKHYENTNQIPFALMERLDQMGMSFAAMAAKQAPKRCSLMPLTVTLAMLRETVEALGCVHRAGYLHGDIQPNNIFFTDFYLEKHQTGTAYLLDFGCARKLDGEVVHIAETEDIFTTQGYTPPELLTHSGGPILLTKAADLYSVGALLLRCVLSESMVRIGNTRLGSVDGSRIGCCGDALDKLNAILEQLLEPDPRKRYQSCDRLLTDLDELLAMVTPPTYLLPGLPAASYFVGRATEISAITEAVNAGSQPMVYGVAGYGKSEAAALAARQIKSIKGAYFVSYQGTMRSTILSMFPQRKHLRETEQERYDNNLALLAQNYHGAVLVIDNFWTQDKLLSQLQKEPAYGDLIKLCPGIKLIFTTRYPVNGGIEIGPLRQPELLQLMRFHLEDTPVPEADLLALIQKTQGHTLLLILIAKLLSESVLRVTPAMVLDALEKGTLHNFDDYTLPADRIGSKGREYPEEQLRSYLVELFRLYDLDEEKQRILCCAALLPSGGMDLRMFQEALGTEKPVLDLARMGLMKRSGNILRIHDLIRTTVREDLKPQAGHCRDFLDALWARFDEGEFRSEYLQIAECLSNAVEVLAPNAFIHDRAAAIFGFLGQYERALALYQEMLEISSSSQGVSSVTLASILNAIGALYGKLGHYQAQRDTHVTAICLLGGEEYGFNTGTLLPLDWNNIVMEQAPLELAKTYLKISGSYENDREADRARQIHKANAYAEMALAVLEKYCPDGPPEVYLDTYLMLARTLADKAEWDNAVCCLEKAESLLDTMPDIHPITQINVRIAMAEVLNRRKDYGKELPIRREILAIAKEFYAGEHPDLGYMQYALAAALWNNEDHPAAVLALRDAIDMMRKALPQKHPALAASLQLLSSFYIALGQEAPVLGVLLDAAEAGSAAAMKRLAIAHHTGAYSCERDMEKSFQWFSMAAEAGDDWSAYMLGQMLLRGEGCERDPKQAEAYFLKATAAQPPISGKSWFALGLLYRGEHPDAPEHPKDLYKAITYFRRAELCGEDVNAYAQLTKETDI